MGIRIYCFIKDYRNQFKQNQIDGINFNYLFFDLNFPVYLVLNSDEMKQKAYPDPQFYSLFYKKFFELIEDIINQIQPNKLIYFAFDGVSPRGKFRLQLNRRLFRLKTDQGTLCGIDSSSVTAGTKFMHNLHLEFDTFIRNLKKKNKLVANIDVYYSSCYESGEGEFKIFKFIKEQKLDRNGHYALFGKDGDLIIYSLAAKIDNLFIINKQNLIDFDYDRMEVRCIREMLLKDFKYLDDKKGFNYDRIMKDLILIMMFVGTDYLNAVPGFTNISQTLRQIIDLYIRFQDESYYKYLTEDHHGLNLENFKSFVDSMKILDKILAQKIRINVNDKKNADQKLNTIKKNYYENVVKLINYNKCKHRYFAKMTSSYLRTMYWNLELYHTNLLSWNLNFDHFWPPFISDFKFEKENINLTYELSNPLLPLQSLIYILPANSILLLPDNLHQFKSRMISYENLNEIVPNRLLYKDDFFDINQTFDKLDNELNLIIFKLNKEEAQQNQILPLYLYVCEPIHRQYSNKLRLVRKELKTNA